MNRLPQELTSYILLLATNRPDLAWKQRRLAYLECLLVCRSFRDCLSSPSVKSQWLVNYHDRSDVSALNFAIRRNWLDLVKILSQSHLFVSETNRNLVLSDCLVNAVCCLCALDQTSHDFTRSLGNAEDIIRYLISSGADPHVMNEFPCRRLCKHGHLGLVSFLVDECKCLINVKNNEALEFAVIEGHLDVAEYLLDHGASAIVGLRKACQLADAETFGLIFKLAKNDVMERIVQDFMNTEDVRFLNYYVEANIRNNPLIILSKTNLIPMMKPILEELVHYTQHEESLKEKILGYCVYFASVANKIESVILLCEYGAEQFYALKLACEYGHTELARRLLDDNFNLINFVKYREDMIDMMRNSVHWEISDLLIQRTGIDWDQVRNNFLFSTHPSSLMRKRDSRNSSNLT